MSGFIKTPHFSRKAFHSQAKPHPLNVSGIVQFEKRVAPPEENDVPVTAQASPTYRQVHAKKAWRNLLLIPILPVLGYFLLDATGITDKIAHTDPAMQRIMGEGFGHAGLCFSLHYVVNAGSHFWKALKGHPPKKGEEDTGH